MGLFLALHANPARAKKAHRTTLLLEEALKKPLEDRATQGRPSRSLELRVTAFENHRRYGIMPNLSRVLRSVASPNVAFKLATARHSSHLAASFRTAGRQRLAVRCSFVARCVGQGYLAQPRSASADAPQLHFFGSCLSDSARWRAMTGEENTNRH